MSTVVRLVLIYVVIVAGLRVLGKREFSQLSPLELVTLLLIPELVSQAIIGDDFSITNAIVAMATLFVLVYVSTLLRFHYRKVNRLIEGVPTVLVHDGIMYAERLEMERISEREIFAEMHKSGLTELQEVQWVILESDGRMAVIAKDDSRTEPPEPPQPT